MGTEIKLENRYELCQNLSSKMIKNIIAL